MKISMFTNTYLPHVGGVARSVDSFATDLRARGHQVLVVAPTYPEADGSDDPPDEVLRVPAIQNFNGSDFSVSIPTPFIIDERLDVFEPDVIHSHHPFLLGDAAMRAARHRRLPLIFTHHTLYERYTHYVSSDSDAMKRFAIRLSTEYANLCARVVAPSESVARLLEKRGVDQPMVVIPTGVDTRFFAGGDGKRFRKANNIPAGASLIGHLGRLAQEKNLDYLAEAVAQAMEKDEGAWFLVVGAGPSEEGIRRKFEDRGLDGRLALAGKRTGEDLADAYAAMDLFVFSSLSETQGMVLTEAMAAGRPVIALDASGAREVVEDGVNGRLLPRDAPAEDFALAINHFFQTPEAADAWRAASVRTAADFSRSACADRLERTYSDAVSESRRDRENIVTDRWDDLLVSIKAEWDLLAEKASAVSDMVWEPEGDREATLD